MWDSTRLRILLSEGGHCDTEQNTWTSHRIDGCGTRVPCESHALMLLPTLYSLRLPPGATIPTSGSCPLCPANPTFK